MKIRPLTSDESPIPLICESFLLTDCSSIDDLMDAFKKHSTTENSILLTLDDLGQAEYTNGHSCMRHDLDDIEGHDLSTVDASAFEDGEHVGYLSHPSEFFIRKGNFLKKANGYDFSSACSKKLTLEADEIELLIQINKNPIPFLDKKIVLSIVPVTNSYEAISHFPNGYFSDDLNPFENYGLAKHLSNQYRYEFLGIGASLIGFLKNKDLSKNDTHQLMEDLAKLYNSTTSAIEKIINSSSDILFLKYTSYLE